MTPEEPGAAHVAPGPPETARNALWRFLAVRVAIRTFLACVAVDGLLETFTAASIPAALAAALPACLAGLTLAVVS